MKIDTKRIEGLVVKAQNGDADSFSLIYDELITPIYRFVFFRVPTEEIAEDITSETFLLVWKNIQKYKPTKGAQFSSWVFRIAQNKIIDFFRTKKDTLELKEELEIPAPLIADGAKNVDNEILREHLTKALSHIPESQSESIILKYFSELSNTEISEVMDKSETAVRILQSRGLKALRKYIDF